MTPAHFIASIPADPPVADTRSLILKTARDLVQTQSYQGFSFKNLAEAVGIKKGSLYYHFESKEALAAAMLAEIFEHLEKGFAAVESFQPLFRLQCYVELFKQHIGAGEKLCPAGVFAAQWDQLGPELRAEVKKVTDLHVAWLQKTICEGIESGQLVDDSDTAEDLAMGFIAAIQGALIVARMAGDPDLFANVMRMHLQGITA